MSHGVMRSRGSFYFATLTVACIALTACSSSRSLYKVASAGESRRAAVRLMDEGSDVNEVNPSTGWTPLQAAAANGHPKMCQTLIDHGANVNAQDSKGMTPLHLAIARGHDETAGVLRAAGADTSIKNGDGKTPDQMTGK